MAYSYTNSKGKTYYLHGKDRVSKKGKKSTLYFFSKEIKEGALNSIPAGYMVAETKTGLPVLKKSSPAP